MLLPHSGTVHAKSSIVELPFARTVRPRVELKSVDKDREALSKEALYKEEQASWEEIHEIQDKYHL